MGMRSDKKEEKKIYSQREGVLSYQGIISGSGLQKGSKLMH